MRVRTVAVGRPRDVPGPRAAALLAVALATVAAVALLAAIPARLGARRAAAPVLSAELA